MVKEERHAKDIQLSACWKLLSLELLVSGVCLQVVGELVWRFFFSDVMVSVW